MENKHISIDELVDIVHELNSRLADESDHEDVLAPKFKKLLDFLYFAQMALNHYSKNGGE
tara:strand:+ start:435 stop:614 length:180 start_codon:yes stop_codon:yes gene_type:complete